MAIVMTASELINAAKHIALNRNTYYDNTYPNNLGYYHENGYLSFDCWNTIKAIIWSRGTIKDNYTVGNFAAPDPSMGLGDWTGREIINNCSNVSGDFSYVTPGEFLLTPDDEHAGLFVGDFSVNGYVYNVIETTGAWEGGTLCSYVSSDGTRYNHKGGWSNYCWGWHGIMPWIDYASAPSGKKTVDELANEVIAGLWGNYPERKERLEAAGYSYDAVQARVNEILSGGKSVDEIAQEVIAGKWGNYPERKELLEVAGYDYATIQARVNELCSCENNSDLIESLASEVIDGKWGNNPERKDALTSKYGADIYTKVQTRVNEILA